MAISMNFIVNQIILYIIELPNKVKVLMSKIGQNLKY